MATVNIHAAKTHFSRAAGARGPRRGGGDRQGWQARGPPRPDGASSRTAPPRLRAWPRPCRRTISTRRCPKGSWPTSADAGPARHPRLPLVGARRCAPVIGCPRPDRRPRRRDPVQCRQRLGDRDQGPHRPPRPTGRRAGLRPRSGPSQPVPRAAGRTAARAPGPRPARPPPRPLRPPAGRPGTSGGSATHPLATADSAPYAVDLCW